MSYPQPMANWDAMVRQAMLAKTREARMQAVRATYPVPDFLRADAQRNPQGELFDTDRR